MIKRNSFGLKYITSLQTTLTAALHLAEGQVLLEKETLNMDNSLIYRTRKRPRHNSGAQLLAYHRGGPGSIPGQVCGICGG
jgi:hypothetical protein